MNANLPLRRKAAGKLRLSPNQVLTLAATLFQAPMVSPNQVLTHAARVAAKQLNKPFHAATSGGRARAKGSGQSNYVWQIYVASNRALSSTLAGRAEFSNASTDASTDAVSNPRGLVRLC